MVNLSASKMRALIREKLVIGESIRKLGAEIGQPDLVRQESKALVDAGYGRRDGDRFIVKATVTVTEAAQMTTISDRRLRCICSEGTVKNELVGKTYVINSSSLKSFLRKRKAGRPW